MELVPRTAVDGEFMPALDEGGTGAMLELDWPEQTAANTDAHSSGAKNGRMLIVAKVFPFLPTAQRGSGRLGQVNRGCALQSPGSLAR
jgi:hypothetical protein